MLKTVLSASLALLVTATKIEDISMSLAQSLALAEYPQHEYSTDGTMEYFFDMEDGYLDGEAGLEAFVIWI